MSYWNHVETRTDGPFEIVLDWTYETASLYDCFDDTVDDIEDMIDRCNRHIDTHYIARVRAMYNGKEYGVSHLGSCYAYDCFPEEDMKNEIYGYLPDMIEEAKDEAAKNLREMKEKLEKDFA